MREQSVLRTVFKGYHKMQVMVLLDALNALILAVENGDIPQEEALKQADELMRKPLQKALGGFHMEDVDNCLKDMLTKLREDIH